MRLFYLSLLFVGLLILPTSTAIADGKALLKQSGVQGGLIVHLGCGDGKLTTELSPGDPFVVHALDADPENVEKTRERIRKQGLYGRLSAELLREQLPYADNLVNLLVVEHPGEISRKEMLRVLAPNGVLMIREKEQWTKTVKPWPQNRDQWTHFLHGPDGNPVAKDSVVGQPRHIQWLGSPKFSRGHEQQASFSSCVTAGGRMFYIADEAPAVDIRFPSQWKLVARDAFNGVILWKRDIGKWVDQFRRFRSGPANLQFRIVASEDLLFATLNFEAPLSILHAATGKTLQTIKGSEYTKQILHENGKLTLLTDAYVGRIDEIDAARRRGKFIQRTCGLLKVDAKTGKHIWSHDIKDLVFANAAMKNGRLFVQTPKSVLCLDDNTGKQLWESKFSAQLKLPAARIKNDEMQWESPSLLVGGGVVFAADFKALHAYSVKDGKLLWTAPSHSAYNAPPDMHLVKGLLWTDRKGKRVALDPLSGGVKKQFTPHRGYMHARCYRNKATEDFLMLGQMGVQILDFDKGNIADNDWVRGTCQYGILPANGLLYVPPNCCACNMKTKLIGITALASSPVPDRTEDPVPVLEKGPAFGNVKKEDISPNDWPTFRSDAERTGTTNSIIPEKLKANWKVKIGGQLSALTIANGRVFVSAKDQHTIYALDAKTGKTLWTYSAGGAIDSPPTIYNGIAFFGSVDGWVYAVRAIDGELVWRLRAAPKDRRIMNDGQLESAWPVHGSVLIHKGELKVAAGRSSYLDGGIRLYRIEPESGKVLHRTVMYSPTDEGKQPQGGGRDVRGALSDILLAQDNDVFMRHVKLDFAKGDETGTGRHLYSPLGFLDDTWWHRAYWVYSDHFTSHWSGWWRVGNEVPSGRIMAYNGKSIYGFGRDSYNGGNTGQWRGGEKYHLYSVDRSTIKPNPVPNTKGKKGKKKAPKAQFDYRWTTDVPLLATGLVVGKNAVVIAGPPDVIKTAGSTGTSALKLLNPEETVAAWSGNRGGILYVASTDNGAKRMQYSLPSPPVFDGLSAANNHLFLSLKDGCVMSMATPE